MSDWQPKISVERRLRPLYIAAFFQGFIFWYAVEKLFMHNIGINDAGIASVVVIFTLVMTVANLPFGIVADRWSRRGVLIIATLFLVIATIIDGLSHSFLPYLIGSCLWGIYYACYTGTYDSIIYDLLIEETGTADRFEHYYGRVQLYDGVALVVSSLASGALVHVVSLRGIYFMTAPFSCIAVFALVRFNEPKLHRAAEKVLLLKHLKAILHAVLRRREVLWLTLSLVLLTVAARITLEFDQLWLIALLLPLSLYGPVNALLLGGYGISGLTAKVLKSRRSLVGLFGILMAGASVCMLFHVLVLTILALFLLIACGTALDVIINRWLHDTLPSNIRAGASSAVVTIGYGLFLPLGLLLGAISNQKNIFQASWLLIGVCIALALAVLSAAASVRKSSPGAQAIRGNSK